MKTDIQEFGAKILRQKAVKVVPTDIPRAETQQLIKAMRGKLLDENLGVALAAPQVGVSKRVVVVAVRATAHRPHMNEVDLVMINPVITETFGRRVSLWEGCLSAGTSGLFAKVLRYRKVEVEYLDENGNRHKTTFEGLLAQIAQHETDHLNGVLFVDHAKDPTTYMTKREYMRMMKAQQKSGRSSEL